MDLANIKIVVQWKATCSLCTLWQRFGRAARGGQNGTAILLVEKKDTDEERQAKAKKEIAAALKKSKEGIGTGSKRKSANQLNPPAKRPALTDLTRSTLNGRDDLVTPGSSSSSTPSELTPLEVLKEQRRANYAKRAVKATVQSSLTKGKGKNVEVGSAMDDFINAHLDLGCRRVVPMLVFGNDQRRTLGFYFPHISIRLLCLSQLPTTTSDVTNQLQTAALAANQRSKTFAATFVTLQHLKNSRLRLFPNRRSNHRSPTSNPIQ